MQWFNNIQLAPKLIGCFALVALLAAFVGAAGIVDLQMSQTQLHAITDHALPGILHLQAADSAVNGAIRASRGAALAANDRGLALQYRRGAITSEAQAWHEFVAYAPHAVDSRREVALMAETRRLLVRWRSLDAQTVRLDAAVGARAAAGVSVGTERVVAQALTQDFNSLTMIEEQDIAREVIRANEGHDVAIVRLTVAAALAALLACALGLLIARSIGRRVGAVQVAADYLASGTLADLTRAIEALARGDLEAASARAEVIPFTVGGRDEVGRMATSFRAMQQAIAQIVQALDGARAGLRMARDAIVARTVALRDQATHDDLTGLPNRALLRERLELARTQVPLAFLLLDLDGYKERNDTLGHLAGDALLVELARRLRAIAPADGTLARLGGDEFALLRPVDAPGAIATARLIHRVLAEPFTIMGHTIEVEASIGIALRHDQELDAQTLLRQADVAMYAAKRARSGFVVYAPRLDTHSPARVSLLGDLRRAIEQEQLFLVYQPKISVADQRVIGVEALVRWQHPQHGLIPPDQFIPLAEGTGAIRPLTRWVLDAALRQCGCWRQAGLRLPMAVNLSTRNLHDASLLSTVSDLLIDYQVPPDWLTLEITESAIMEDPAGALVMLTRMSNMGIHLEIDDFGTGYSSLAYLKRLPVGGLKVDRTFVQHLEEDANDAAIVAATIGLAHDLGLHVVAEGVETQAALQRLTAMGCDVAQGYYFSRPLPATEIERWLQARPAEPMDACLREA